jgi:hypothetical protein
MNNYNNLRKQLQDFQLASPSQVLPAIQFKMRERLSSIIAYAQILELQVKKTGVQHEEIYDLSTELQVIGQQLYTCIEETPEIMIKEAKDITQEDIQLLFQSAVLPTKRLTHTLPRIRQCAQAVDILTSDVPFSTSGILKQNIITIATIVSVFSKQFIAVDE